VIFSAPTQFHGSGNAAEWIGRFVRARMPRCDSEDILRGLSGDLLREAARAHGIDDKGSNADLRKRLEGALPDWSPVGFGAPGPAQEDPVDGDIAFADAEAQP